MKHSDSKMSRRETKVFIAIFAGFTAAFVALALFVIIRTLRKSGEMDLIGILFIVQAAALCGWLTTKNMKYGKERGYW